MYEKGIVITKTSNERQLSGWSLSLGCVGSIGQRRCFLGSDLRSPEPSPPPPPIAWYLGSELGQKADLDKKKGISENHAQHLFFFPPELSRGRLCCQSCDVELEAR